MLRIAIVGLGCAGTRQVEAIRELGDRLTVAALMDTDTDHLAERAQTFGIAKTTTDYAAVLADPAIDAVSICTPHGLHCPMALDAAAAGKHILVEKPMALTVAEATRMIDAAAANDVVLYVAEQVAYAPQTRFLRALCRAGIPSASSRRRRCATAFVPRISATQDAAPG